MKVWVLYEDYRDDSGCSGPIRVVTTEAEADTWVDKAPECRCATEFELDVDEPCHFC